MKRMIIIAGLVICGVIVVLNINHKSVVDENTSMEKINSYVLEGQMELKRGKEVKYYDLKVCYLKSKEEYYRVSLFDKELSQEQIILRNGEGVFVLTPNLNQLFRFEGDWPNNSQKPYLLQTIFALTNQKGRFVEKLKDGYLVKVKLNDEDYGYESIFYDNQGKVKWLEIFDKNQQKLVKIDFRICDYNAKVKKSEFSTPQKVDEKVSFNMSEEDLPLYPMETYGATLKNVYQLDTQYENKKVLEYEGERSFTLVESKMKIMEEFTRVMVPYQLYDNMDLIGFFDGNSMSIMHNGIEYKLYADDFSLDEMRKVLESVQVVVLK